MTYLQDLIDGSTGTTDQVSAPGAGGAHIDKPSRARPGPRAGSAMNLTTS